MMNNQLQNSVPSNTATPAEMQGVPVMLIPQPTTYRLCTAIFPDGTPSQVLVPSTSDTTSLMGSAPEQNISTMIPVMLPQAMSPSFTLPSVPTPTQTRPQQQQLIRQPPDQSINITVSHLTPRNSRNPPAVPTNLGTPNQPLQFITMNVAPNTSIGKTVQVNSSDNNSNIKKMPTLVPTVKKSTKTFTNDPNFEQILMQNLDKIVNIVSQQQNVAASPPSVGATATSNVAGGVQPIQNLQQVINALNASKSQVSAQVNIPSNKTNNVKNQAAVSGGAEPRLVNVNPAGSLQNLNYIVSSGSGNSPKVIFVPNNIQPKLNQQGAVTATTNTTTTAAAGMVLNNPSKNIQPRMITTTAPITGVVRASQDSMQSILTAAGVNANGASGRPRQILIPATNPSLLNILRAVKEGTVNSKQIVVPTAATTLQTMLKTAGISSKFVPISPNDRVLLNPNSNVVAAQPGLPPPVPLVKTVRMPIILKPPSTATKTMIMINGNSMSKGQCITQANPAIRVPSSQLPSNLAPNHHKNLASNSVVKINVPRSSEGIINSSNYNRSAASFSQSQMSQIMNIKQETDLLTPEVLIEEGDECVQLNLDTPSRRSSVASNNNNKKRPRTYSRTPKSPSKRSKSKSIKYKIPSDLSMLGNSMVVMHRLNMEYISNGSVDLSQISVEELESQTKTCDYSSWCAVATTNTASKTATTSGKKVATKRKTLTSSAVKRKVTFKPSISSLLYSTSPSKKDLIEDLKILLEEKEALVAGIRETH